MKCLKNFQTSLTNPNQKFKIVLLAIALVVALPSTFAQNGTSYGLKGGLNYNANGDYFESVEAFAENPDRNVGFHIGVFGKFGNRLYFRPELMYTKTRSDYNSGEFDFKKIDAPLLVGIKVIGPLSVFAGPALQYILDGDFDDISIDSVDNDFSVGLNFGVGLNLNKIGIDLRYERGFSENEAQFLDNNNVGTGRLDTRPDQLILSFSVAL
ncbi:MAG: PorT family protein [Bacteroidia bacterium]|nr:PorT family protein [Bacteroidia bacterium]NNL79867.1 PorT family protein [Flavobacteriaceae bacterium]